MLKAVRKRKRAAYQSYGIDPGIIGPSRGRSAITQHGNDGDSLDFTFLGLGQKLLEITGEFFRGFPAEIEQLKV